MDTLLGYYSLEIWQSEVHKYNKMQNIRSLCLECSSPLLSCSLHSFSVRIVLFLSYFSKLKDYRITVCTFLFLHHLLNAFGEVLLNEIYHKLIQIKCGIKMWFRRLQERKVFPIVGQISKGSGHFYQKWVWKNGYHFKNERAEPFKAERRVRNKDKMSHQSKEHPCRVSSKIWLLEFLVFRL